MSVTGKLLRLVQSAAAAVAFMATPAAAADLNSTDYFPLPPGTNVFVSYTNFTTRNEFRLSPGGTSVRDSALDSNVEILRFIRYIDIVGFTVAPQVLLPFGGLYNGKLGGAALDYAAGLGPPILATPVWLVNNTDTRTFLAVTPYVFFPIGNYQAGETLNLGENRWKFNPQIGFVQETLDKTFLLQLSGDAVFYGSNNDATALGYGHLTQKDSYQFQAWLSYSPLVDQTWRVAVGYSQMWGGAQMLNGVRNGVATKSQQIRFEVSKFLAPDLQLLGEVSHDLAVSGGYKQDFVGLVRLAKLW